MSDDHKVGIVVTIAIMLVIFALALAGRSCTASDNVRKAKENIIEIKLTDEAIKSLGGQPLNLRIESGD